jgi:hypothetical protein
LLARALVTTRLTRPRARARATVVRRQSAINI